MHFSILKFNTMTTNNRNPFSIKSIVVKDLFGLYNYTIPSSDGDYSDLIILYGNNGSGKTTILNLAFWLLSTKNNSGFKSNIAKTKFSEFQIVFENDLEVGAKRKPDELIGGFEYYIKKNKRKTHSVYLKTKEDGEGEVIGIETLKERIKLKVRNDDGDNYYKVKNEKHNLVRTHAQYKLLLSMEENYDKMCEIVNDLVKKLK